MSQLWPEPDVDKWEKRNFSRAFRHWLFSLPTVVIILLWYVTAALCGGSTIILLNWIR